jgi:hypothetical protein
MKRGLEAIYRARKEAGQEAGQEVGQEAGQEGVQDNLRDKTAYCLSCYQLRPQQLFKGFYTCELCRKRNKKAQKARHKRWEEYKVPR